MPAPPPDRLLSRDDRRALVTCLVLGVVTIAAFSLVYRGIPSSPLRTAAKSYAGDDLTTGSIVFEPTLGDRCRHRLIDNATWRIRDNGTADCRTVLLQSQNARRLSRSAGRVDVIRYGFNKR
jgi:hypothetical protein